MDSTNSIDSINLLCPITINLSWTLNSQFLFFPCQQTNFKQPTDQPWSPNCGWRALGRPPRSKYLPSASCPQPSRSLVTDHNTGSERQSQTPSQHCQLLPRSDWVCKRKTMCSPWLFLSSPTLWSWIFWLWAEPLSWLPQYTRSFLLSPTWTGLPFQGARACLQGRKPSTGFTRKKREVQFWNFKERKNLRDFLAQPVLWMISLHPAGSMYESHALNLETPSVEHLRCIRPHFKWLFLLSQFKTRLWNIIISPCNRGRDSEGERRLQVTQLWVTEPGYEGGLSHSEVWVLIPFTFSSSSRPRVHVGGRHAWALSGGDTMQSFVFSRRYHQAGEAARPLSAPRRQWRADQGSAPNPAPYLKDHVLTYTEELSIGCPFAQSADVAKAVNWTLFICFSGSWNLDILRWEATECPRPRPLKKKKKTDGMSQYFIKSIGWRIHPSGLSNLAS